MDALVPAFVAALLAGIGDRPARLAAQSPFAATVAGLVLGQGASIVMAIVGAVTIAPLLTPSAQTLLLAIALVLAGLTGLRQSALLPSGHALLPAAALTGVIGGDAIAFLAFALAAKVSAPILAGIGALAGAVVLAIVAATLGPDWQRLPIAALGRVAGVMLIAAGVMSMLIGLRLI